MNLLVIYYIYTGNIKLRYNKILTIYLRGNVVAFLAMILTNFIPIYYKFLK